MTKTELRDLKPGDLITHKIIGDGYIVTGNYSGRIAAIRMIEVANAAEWDLVPAVLPDKPAKGKKAP